MTAQDILRAAEASGMRGDREGVYCVHPPIIVINRSAAIFQAEAVDVQIGNSVAGGLVQFVGENIWHLASEFDILGARMVWTCPNEGERHTKGSTCAGFCPECGVALKQVSLGFVTVNTPCPECKAAVVFPEDKFCRACGVALTQK